MEHVKFHISFISFDSSLGKTIRSRREQNPRKLNPLTVLHRKKERKKIAKSEKKKESGVDKREGRIEGKKEEEEEEEWLTQFSR